MMGLNLENFFLMSYLTAPISVGWSERLLVGDFDSAMYCLVLPYQYNQKAVMMVKASLHLFRYFYILYIGKDL